MKTTEARKILGLDPGDDPRSFIPAFEETVEYKQELVDNAPSDEMKFRYQQELLEYQAAVKVVAGKQKIRPHRLYRRAPSDRLTFRRQLVGVSMVSTKMECQCSSGGENCPAPDGRTAGYHESEMA
jgi:hypothetical protein